MTVSSGQNFGLSVGEYIERLLYHLCKNACTLAFPGTYAKSLQLCPTLCGPRDGSPPGPAVPGILQARALEWVAISFSNA